MVEGKALGKALVIGSIVYSFCFFIFVATDSPFRMPTYALWAARLYILYMHFLLLMRFLKKGGYLAFSKDEISTMLLDDLVEPKSDPILSKDSFYAYLFFMGLSWWTKITSSILYTFCTEYYIKNTRYNLLYLCFLIYLSTKFDSKLT